MTPHLLAVHKLRRAKLLDEKQRVKAALAANCKHAANEDTDLQLAS